MKTKNKQYFVIDGSVTNLVQQDEGEDLGILVVVFYNCRISHAYLLSVGQEELLSLLLASPQSLAHPVVQGAHSSLWGAAFSCARPFLAQVCSHRAPPDQTDEERAREMSHQTVELVVEEVGTGEPLLRISHCQHYLGLRIHLQQLFVPAENEPA